MPINSRSEILLFNSRNKWVDPIGSRGKNVIAMILRMEASLLTHSARHRVGHDEVMMRSFNTWSHNSANGDRNICFIEVSYLLNVIQTNLGHKYHWTLGQIASDLFFYSTCERIAKNCPDLFPEQSHWPREVSQNVNQWRIQPSGCKLPLKVQDSLPHHSHLLFHTCVATIIWWVSHP